MKNSSFYSLKKKGLADFHFSTKLLFKTQQQVQISANVLSREKQNLNSYTHREKKSQTCQGQLIMYDLHIYLITCLSK